MSGKHQPTHDDVAATDALSALELQQLGLSDLDGVIDIAEADALVMNVLRRDANLKDTLEAHELQLAEVEESFIEGHCAQIEDLCQLYAEMSECETKLVSFEEQITGFQQRLTDTAEDIVSMQRETLRVKQRLDNRRDVSHRIKEVYDALNECGTFCDRINSAREVDAEYLDNIRHLARKIGFLTANAELAGSAVDNEIRPQLQATSQRAGDRLCKFLTRKFQGFLEEGTNVALQQQAVERQAQYAFSFLHRFNEPVAMELMAHYVRVMAEVYGRQLRVPLKDLAEVTGLISRDPDNIATAEMLFWLQSGTDGSALFGPSANARVAAPSVLSSAATRRSQSMSIEQRFDNFKSRVAAKMDGREALRSAVFADHIAAVRSVDATYRLITLNPVHVHAIERSTCWAARLNQVFVRLVNNAITESRFVSHFFFVMGPSPDDEEELLRRIFDRLLSDVQARIVTEVQTISCVVTILASMRAVELFKNYISSSADALPLLLLGEVFDVTMGSLRRRAEALLQQHQQSLARATATPLPPLHQVELQMPLVGLLQRVDGLPAALGPHEVTRRFATLAAELELLNSLRIGGSRVSAAEGRRVFDDETDAALSAMLSSLRQLLDGLSRRYPHPLVARLFVINNLVHIVAAFRACSAQLEDSSDSPSQSPGDASDSFQDGGANDSESSPTSAALAAIPCGVEAEAALRGELGAFARDLLRASGSPLAAVCEYTDAAEREYGAAFLDAAPGGDAKPRQAGVAAPVEAEFLAAASAFSRGWHDALAVADADASVYFTGPPSGCGDGGGAAPIAPSPTIAPSPSPSPLSRRSATPALNRSGSAAPPSVAAHPQSVAPVSSELATRQLSLARALLLRAVAQALVVLNNRLHAIAAHFYPRHSAIQAKLVGHLALTHGAGKLLRQRGSSS